MAEETKTSEFNEAILKMARLNRIQETANFCSATGDYLGWLKALENLFKECYAKLNQTEREECLNEISLISKQINTATKRQSAEFMNYNVIGSSPKVDYNKMFLLDCKLRGLLDKYGFSDRNTDEGMF